jgi:SAM-dependent methyltransferase
MTAAGSYTPQFFNSHADGARASARVVVPLVMDLVPCGSVIDVGCGTGVWLSVFAERGVSDIFGIDGEYVDRNSLQIPAANFAGANLTEPLRLERSFDLAVSLEVAEHLPESSASAFIDLLTGLAPTVLFSAAIPYQGGTHHINEQWPEYWAELFEERGFRPIDCLRRRLLANPDVDWWYAQNLLFFADERAREKAPRLWALHRPWHDRGLSIVHPRRYLEWVEWGISRDAVVAAMASSRIGAEDS